MENKELEELEKYIVNQIEEKEKEILIIQGNIEGFHSTLNKLKNLKFIMNDK